MIINTATNAGGFIYCTTVYGPHSQHTYFNDGDGHYHRWLYIIDGKAEAANRLTEDTTTEPVFVRSGDVPGELIDVSNGKGQYITTITGDVGISMMMFNPIPTTRD